MHLGLVDETNQTTGHVTYMLHYSGMEINQLNMVHNYEMTITKAHPPIKHQTHF